MNPKICFLILPAFILVNIYSQSNIREDIILNDRWHTVANDTTPNAYNGFEHPGYNDKQWFSVDIPHNWDDYGNYRVNKHGNRHGYAWYRKSFTVSKENKGKRLFLWFEGVSSYATVWLNGHEVGRHAGGRTSFTLDITDFIIFDQPNVLAIRADHPSGIDNLPWVCGGCSPEYGFSEGSQPMGIFRPVHLIITAPVRIEPFGVHAWNNNDISEKSATLRLNTEIKNYGAKPYKIILINRLTDKEGGIVFEIKSNNEIVPGKIINVQQESPVIPNPHLWSPDDPYLYTIVSEICVGDNIIDRTSMPFGIRWIEWSESNQFLINGQPFFINGICEYEHLLGQSHAFSNEQVFSRAMQMRAAGFNAFRDAHQPHNLKYQEYWDKLGMLWWPQFAAHIWFDNPGFRNNFKTLIKDWVKERRNSPSVILWGLENESTLPQSFAEECSDIIRELDPTVFSQRKITTCNGGKGTDWDVPQNWTGTYGGDPAKYAADIQKQKLVGEYGAWRSIDKHTERYLDKDDSSENRMTQLMELKVRLADSVKDKCYGHFHWLFTSHDNPGRMQTGEGFRNIDRIGPVNHKGLLTPWEEPLDVYYMYRANFADKNKDPMVYIVSHTWPDRWISAGIKNGITVYSNCDEVELFNDINSRSLGKRTKNGIGTHFQWDSINIAYNVLYAEGKINGKVVAKDYIVLHHLPHSPNFKSLFPDSDAITRPVAGYNYLYRINCGGPEYKDQNGNIWLADASGKAINTWRSSSWADNNPELPPYFASQRRTFDPVKGTRDWPLFQTFRYGRHKLNYTFPVPDGKYLVELFFIEPWLGTGGGIDCKGWRLFDIAINDSTVLQNFDIWNESGHDQALKKTIVAYVKGGNLSISFPTVASGQAIISAIAIATRRTDVNPAPAPESIIKNLEVKQKGDCQWQVQSWLDIGAKQFANNECTFSYIPKELFSDTWIRTANHNKFPSDTGSIASFSLTDSADVYIALDTGIISHPNWLKDWKLTKLKIESDHNGGTCFKLYKKYFSAGAQIHLYANDFPGMVKTNMYTIIIHKPSVLEKTQLPARRPVTYEAEDAKLQGLIYEDAIKAYSGKGYVIVADSGTVSIDWFVQVGIGDTYGLRFQYINSSSKEIIGKMSVIAEDGNLLSTGNIYFSPTTGISWDKVNTTTGTSINAGLYIIRLVLTNASGLAIDNLKVQ